MKHLDCERGDPALRPTLHVSEDLRGGGELVIPCAGAEPCTIELPDRFVRLLVAIARAWQEDREDRPDRRGYRTKDKIVRLMMRLPNGSKVSDDAVPNYVFLTRREIAGGLARGSASERSVALIEARRGRGYRIGASGLRVVVHRAGGELEEGSRDDRSPSAGERAGESAREAVDRLAHDPQRIRSAMARAATDLDGSTGGGATAQAMALPLLAPVGEEEALRADFRLLVDLPEGAEAPAASVDAAASLPVLCIPMGSSALLCDDGGVRLVPERDAGASTLRLEVLAADPASPRLVARAPVGGALRLNGQLAPVLTWLEPGDELQVGQVVLHVTRYHHCRIGPPPPALVGVPCGVCRVPVAEEATVLVHDCGELLHLEPASTPEAERLECASFPTCPRCEQPIRRESGYVHLPELGS